MIVCVYIYFVLIDILYFFYIEEFLEFVVFLLHTNINSFERWETGTHKGQTGKPIIGCQQS